MQIPYLSLRKVAASKLPPPLLILPVRRRKNLQLNSSVSAFKKGAFEVNVFRNGKGNVNVYRVQTLDSEILTCVKNLTTRDRDFLNQSSSFDWLKKMVTKVPIGWVVPSPPSLLSLLSAGLVGY